MATEAGGHLAVNCFLRSCVAALCSTALLPDLPPCLFWQPAQRRREGGGWIR